MKCLTSLRYLVEEKFGINAKLPNLTFILPDKHTDGLYCVDTCDLWGALEGIPQDKRKLERVCQELGLKPKNMHNAGNDAYFTLAAVRTMAEGAPLDLQRQARFPDRVSGLTILEPAEDEDELDDDMPKMSQVVNGGGKANKDTAA